MLKHFSLPSLIFTNTELYLQKNLFKNPLCFEIELPCLQTDRYLLSEGKTGCVTDSVAESEPPGAAPFRVEPGTIFYLARAESRSRLFYGGSGCIF